MLTNVYLPWGQLPFKIVSNVKALVGAFNQEKVLLGAFSVIVQPVVEPMDSFTALIFIQFGSDYCDIDGALFGLQGPLLYPTNQKDVLLFMGLEIGSK